MDVISDDDDDDADDCLISVAREFHTCLACESC